MLGEDPFNLQALVENQLGNTCRHPAFVTDASENRCKILECSFFETGV